MKVETTDEGLRAVDAAKTALTVETDGWTPGGDAPPMPAPDDTIVMSAAPDTVVSGEASRLRFPPVHATVNDLETGATLALGTDTGPLPLADGSYLVRIGGGVRAFVRFDGEATLSKPEYERLELSFQGSTPVTVGFVTRVRQSDTVATVPRTPQGVATALSLFPAGHRTATPDRSFPTMRGEPPRVSFGDQEDVPTVLRKRREPTDVRLELPADIRYLLPAASFAHYLGAEVVATEGATPTLQIRDETWTLPSLPDFQFAVARRLRQVFLLDCVARGAGPYGVDLGLLDEFDGLELDPQRLYAAPIADRVAAYLDTPFEAVKDALPDWHLSMYVKPTYDHIEVLPYVLSGLPNLFLPTSDPLDEEEWLTRSLGDFYRGERATAGEVASIDLVEPSLGPGRMHGWLADGVPIDVFKTIPEAYPNRERYLETTDDPISVLAILNDRGMRGEHETAVETYRTSAVDLDLDITVRENLRVDELATAFETRHDLVHYIGHCETEGLKCSDGYLSVDEIGESKAQTFFLNACGSYEEGLKLIRKGSVAGGVTFREVLDSQAAVVGATFARLMMYGYCIERALDKARRRIMTGKDYAVVGDGTHVLTQSDDLVPPDVAVDRLDGDRFSVRYGVESPRLPGSLYHPYIQNDDTMHLTGTEQEFEVDQEELRDFLDYLDRPVLFDGDLAWSDEVLDDLD